MATYKTSELINRLCEIINEGYEYVDISELEAHEELPISLSFEGIDELGAVDYDSVYSCKIPDDYDYHADSKTVPLNDYCCEIGFTYNEIFTIKHAVDNALEYFKDCLKDSSYSKETIANIKFASVSCRNLQAKLAKFLKSVKV